MQYAGHCLGNSVIESCSIPVNKTAGILTPAVFTLLSLNQTPYTSGPKCLRMTNMLLSLPLVIVIPLQAAF